MPPHEFQEAEIIPNTFLKTKQLTDKDFLLVSW